MKVYIPLDTAMTDQEVLETLHQGVELARRLHRVDAAFREAHPGGVIDEVNFPADQQPGDMTDDSAFAEG